MASYMGIMAPLIGFLAGKQFILVWMMRQAFLYAFLIFFLIGLPFAL